MALDEQAMLNAPPPLPARMLNQFVYCPRLFYLEWVDKRWADSGDTALGDLAHRNVDSRGGRMPEPGADEAPRSTSRVDLFDPDLGIVAVIDRVDHSDGSCTPVDLKKGRCAPDGEAWPGDRAQVLAQALLLRSHGYTVESAEVSYLASNTKVSVPVTDEAVEEVLDLVAAARSTAAALKPPLPLVNSPKCPRCSLAPLCLPDETNEILDRSERRPRRIVPRDTESRPVYVTTQGAVVKVDGRRMKVVADGETLVDCRLLDVSQVCVVGNVQVTTQAMAALWRAGAVVVYLSYGGWFNGFTQGPPGKHVELRRRQVIMSAQGLPLAVDMIRGKIHNQRVMLRRNSKDAIPEKAIAALKELELGTRDAHTLAELLGIEGVAARLYFENFAGLLSPASGFAAEFEANGRTRRPPLDPVNAVLGFCYALLTKDLVSTLVGCGLDPYLGVLHRSRYGRPALALDLAEEFRPLVAESVTLQCFNNGELRESDFIRHPNGVRLTTDGRKAVLAAYERRCDHEIRHPMFGYTISYRRVMDVQARILAAAMIGELPCYTPLMTR